MQDLVKTNILGIGVTNTTGQKIVDFVVSSLSGPKEKYFVVTPNPEIIVYANQHPLFKNILNSAKLSLCDGVGVRIASLILGSPLKERFTGVEMVEKLCEKLAKKPITVGFLGGRGSVAEETARCLQHKYSGLRVVFVEASDPSENAAVLLKKRVTDAKGVMQKDVTSSNKGSVEGDGTSTSQHGHLPSIFVQNQYLRESNYVIDVLFVAYGFPKQEEWLAKYSKTLPVRVGITVGGAFDYISGSVPRAPLWLRSLGLEWLFRLVVEPWRIRRQVALPKFVFLVLKERLSFK